jgi:hypothetical protein
MSLIGPSHHFGKTPAWRHRGGATTRAFATVDRTFNDLAVLAVQNCDHHLVAAIHVSAEFQTTQSGHRLCSLRVRPRLRRGRDHS